MLLANGPLRNDLKRTDAAETYATVANPATYDLQVRVGPGTRYARVIQFVAGCLI